MPWPRRVRRTSMQLAGHQPFVDEHRRPLVPLAHDARDVAELAADIECLAGVWMPCSLIHGNRASQRCDRPIDNPSYGRPTKPTVGSSARNRWRKLTHTTSDCGHDSDRPTQELFADSSYVLHSQRANPETPEARILAAVGALVVAARDAGVRDELVLAAIAAVPRLSFVPTQYIRQADFDAPIPIPHGQVTTQPSLVARMVEALSLAGGERVLEVGTGYGWQTGLLSQLAREVFSVERFTDLAETARANLAGRENVRVVVGDGSAGLPEHAPFDAILVAAAYPSVPVPLAEQLAEGGRLVQPLGPGGAEEVVLFEKRRGALQRVRSLGGAHFVRLHGRHGFA
jgi:protein-L-isoaspartate(D-aspartate) O-methyltransferase